MHTRKDRLQSIDDDDRSALLDLARRRPEMFVGAVVQYGWPNSKYAITAKVERVVGLFRDGCWSVHLRIDDEKVFLEKKGMESGFLEVVKVPESILHLLPHRWLRQQQQHPTWMRVDEIEDWQLAAWPVWVGNAVHHSQPVVTVRPELSNMVGMVWRPLVTRGMDLKKADGVVQYSTFAMLDPGQVEWQFWDGEQWRDHHAGSGYQKPHRPKVWATLNDE